MLDESERGRSYLLPRVGEAEEFLTIKYDVSQMFFLDVLYQVDETSSVTSFLKSF